MGMPTVALMANTIHYARGGGHRWVALNWALGFRSIGCDVFWLEWLDPRTCRDAPDLISALETHLRPYGFADRVLVLAGPEAVGAGLGVGPQGLDLESVTARADVLVNFVYALPAEVVRRFRRSAVIDIDPGVLQTSMARGELALAPHDVHFTIGETVGTASALFPDAGRRWTYTPPCVSLDAWPACPSAADDAPFSTITHWWSGGYMSDGAEWYPNHKRSGFLPFLDLPGRVARRLELGLYGNTPEDAAELEAHGWRVRHSFAVASTPWDYQAFIRASRGEFSCVKPSCLRFQNAWISDRTLCYLASGRPAVVQHTGPSRILPEARGLLRFTDVESAIARLKQADDDYDHHRQAARRLVEEHFDARQVSRRLLEQALA
jgi:hypothetical protein